MGFWKVYISTKIVQLMLNQMHFWNYWTTSMVNPKTLQLIIDKEQWDMTVEVTRLNNVKHYSVQ